MRAVGAIEPGRLGLPDGQRPPDRDFRANHYATMRRTLLSAYRHLEGSSCVERRRSKREGPLWASVGKARPRPGSFSPRLPPLPTGEATDEAQEAELLQAVEQQFKDLPPMEEPAPVRCRFGKPSRWLKRSRPPSRSRTIHRKGRGLARRFRPKFVFPVGSLFRLRVSHHLGRATFPAPASSNAACGFPAYLRRKSDRHSQFETVTWLGTSTRSPLSLL